MTTREILREEVESHDINYLIKNYLEVYGYNKTLQQFVEKDEEAYKSFLVNKKDFKTEDMGMEAQGPVRLASRKFTEDLIGVEMARMESIDCWTPDISLRKTSTYSTPGMDRGDRKKKEAKIDATELLNKRYEIKNSILNDTTEEIRKKLSTSVPGLLGSFPEILLQVDLLDLQSNIDQKGITEVIKDIKAKYEDLKDCEVILYSENSIYHHTVQELAGMLMRIGIEGKQNITGKLQPYNCRLALWEKVNSSILRQLDYLSLSSLDIINGHYDFMKQVLSEENDCCFKLVCDLSNFQQLSTAVNK